MARSAQVWPRYIFWAVLLDFGKGGLVVTREQKLLFKPAFPLIITYPSARRMGRALSALALPYKMGGSMGASRVDLSQEVEFTTFRRFKSTKSLN